MHFEAHKSLGFSLLEVMLALVLLSLTMLLSFQLLHRLYQHEARIQAGYQDLGLIVPQQREGNAIQPAFD